VKDIYLVQLIGVLIAAADTLALTASAVVYVTPWIREEKRRQESRTGNRYHLPFNLETVISTLFLLAGMAFLIWAKFDMCMFLAHWLPSLPEAFPIFLSCL
jgi:hypothetical protein